MKYALPSSSTGTVPSTARARFTEAVLGIGRPVWAVRIDGSGCGKIWYTRSAVIFVPAGHGAELLVDVDHAHGGFGRAIGRQSLRGLPGSTGGVGRDGDGHGMMAADLRVAVDQLLVAEAVHQVQPIESLGVRIRGKGFLG